MTYPPNRVYSHSWPLARLSQEYFEPWETLLDQLNPLLDSKQFRKRVDKVLVITCEQDFIATVLIYLALVSYSCHCWTSPDWKQDVSVNERTHS